MSAARMPASDATGSSRGAAKAYDALAEAYDVLTAAYCHDEWLRTIERLAARHGLRGRRLLDLGCGTGKSFLPLLERGYRVTGVDISPRMVAIARAKAPRAALAVADMCELESLGAFDLITCLDDAVNYVLDTEQLAGFFGGLSRNLAAGGVGVFDVNSMRLYKDSFMTHWLMDSARTFIAWNGATAGEITAGDRLEATVDVFTATGRLWSRTQSRHRQRHWPRSELDAAAVQAGLRIEAVYGQRRGARLDETFDELEHHKALCFVTRDQRR